MRRALTHVGGSTRTEGDPRAAAELVAALDVPSSIEAEELSRAHVHGFHSYPARMHPATARRLCEAFSAPGDRVLDPFCGSGTVLVEARLAGREAIGVDANPLAVRLARLKTQPTTEGFRARLVAAARSAAELADTRRKAKSGASRAYGKRDMALFQPHILLELDSLRLSIEGITEDEPVKSTLELVLSSILIKLSRKSSDTTGHEAERRLAAGYPARLFVRKTEELASRLGEVAERLARGPFARVLEGDARVLEGVADGSIQLVLTSPPYPGVYDYLSHHEERLRWLKLHTGRFDNAEIGARRRLDPLGPQAGRARWKKELGDTLAAMERVLAERGAAILLIADSVVCGEPMFAVDMIRDLTRKSSLALRAVASQERPHFHGPTARAFARRPRGEHAILLVKERVRKELWHDAPRRPLEPTKGDEKSIEQKGRDRGAARPQQPRVDSRGMQQGRGKGRRGGR